MTWLSVTEACAYLGCSRQTFYRELQKGALRPDGRVGKRLRFRTETLDQYACGTLKEDSTRHSARREASHANQTKQAESNLSARDLEGRTEQVPRTRLVDRPENGKEAETRRRRRDAIGRRS